MNRREKKEVSKILFFLFLGFIFAGFYSTNLKANPYPGDEVSIETIENSQDVRLVFSAIKDVVGKEGSIPDSYPPSTIKIDGEVVDVNWEEGDTYDSHCWNMPTPEGEER